jgi:asparagine synthase (glutamine-hydrolysing)
VLTPIGPAVKQVSTRDIFRDVLRGHDAPMARPEDYVNHSLYLEARTFLHGLLVVEDKLSMAHSMETRVPFLDNDLVELAMRVPVRLKLGRLGGGARADDNLLPRRSLVAADDSDGKLLLRAAMRRHVPCEVLDRKKQGFSAPDASWFRGESIDYVRDLLFRPRARLYDFLARDAVQALVTEHLDGKQNRRLLIWSLLYLETWLEKFL